MRGRVKTLTDRVASTLIGSSASLAVPAGNLLQLVTDLLLEFSATITVEALRRLNHAHDSSRSTRAMVSVDLFGTGQKSAKRVRLSPMIKTYFQ